MLYKNLVQIDLPDSIMYFAYNNEGLGEVLASRFYTSGPYKGHTSSGQVSRKRNVLKYIKQFGDPVPCEWYQKDLENEQRLLKLQ